MSQRAWIPARGQEASLAHDVLTSATILAVGLVFLLAGIDSLWGDAPADLPLPAKVALLVAGCVALLAKRRRPVLVLVVVLVLAGVDTWGGEQLGLLLVAVDALYGAARWSSPRQHATLQTLLWVVGVGLSVLALALTADVRATLVIALQVFALLGTPYWWGTAVRRAEVATALAEQRAADAQLLAERDRAEALRQERLRTAGDIHDALSGHLAAIAIHADAALALPPQRHAEQRGALVAVRDSGRLALADLQSLVLLLREDGDTVRTSAPRLEGLADLLAGLTPGTGGVTVEGAVPRDLPALVDTALYLVVQEALTNAVRHAPGAPVVLRWERTPDAAGVSVRNPVPAPGEAPAADVVPAGTGTGLASMRRRVDDLAGSFAAGPDPAGRAWQVAATVPTVPGARP